MEGRYDLRDAAEAGRVGMLHFWIGHLLAMALTGAWALDCMCI